jgi:hypothetical protein
MEECLILYHSTLPTSYNNIGMSTILVIVELSTFLTRPPPPPRLEGELKECNIIPPGQDPAQTKETYWILQKRAEEPATDLLMSR